MGNSIADFVASYWVVIAATFVCLVPSMILEELEIHRSKKRRKRK